MMAIKLQLLLVLIFVIDIFAHSTVPENKKVTGVLLRKISGLTGQFNHDPHGIFGGLGSRGVSGLDSRGGRSKSQGNGGQVETGGTRRRGGSGRRGGSNRRGGSRRRIASRWRWWTPL